jgi:hypothetical protein
VKEHIKEYGHYGPHSANDRPRRSGNVRSTDEIIKAVFEEWTLESNETQNKNLHSQRKIQSCEYDPRKTKLWHNDDTGDLYLRVNSLEDDVLEGVLWHQCLVSDCYYQLHAPEGLGATVFKTLKGLHEHYRRSHEVSNEIASLTWPIQSLEGAESASSLVSMDSIETSRWFDISHTEAEVPFWEDQERIFEDEEEFLEPNQDRTSTWETGDSQHSDDFTCFPTSTDALLFLPPTHPPSLSINEPDSWLSIPYYDHGDIGARISPLLTDGGTEAETPSSAGNPTNTVVTNSNFEAVGNAARGVVASNPVALMHNGAALTAVVNSSSLHLTLQTAAETTDNLIEPLQGSAVRNTKVAEHIATKGVSTTFKAIKCSDRVQKFAKGTGLASASRQVQGAWAKAEREVIEKNKRALAMSQSKFVQETSSHQQHHGAMSLPRPQSTEPSPR